MFVDAAKFKISLLYLLCIYNSSGVFIFQMYADNFDVDI